jgi:hypothetical protein
MKIKKDEKENYKHYSKLLALSVRNQLEGLHSEGVLPQENMKEINTIIRDSIYSGLILFHKANLGDEKSKQILSFIRLSLPDYWEEPKEIKL